MNKDLSRRKFLERFAAGTATLPLLRNAAQAAPRALPHRVLGRTGASVSILAFGCGSRFLMYAEEEMARVIGMTSHTDGAVMAQAIEHHDLDCVQMALNASRNGRFEELALPAARKKRLGVIAMKVTGQEFLLGTDSGKTDIDSLLRYSLSLPVTT